MIDLPPLDLDASSEKAREWFTPFTSQLEKGEYDWDLGEGRGWYELEGDDPEGELEGTLDHESRKNR
jgi:hypothetical protein